MRRAARGDVVRARGRRAGRPSRSRPSRRSPLAAERVTVNVAVVVPALPSVTVTSPIDRVGAGSSSVIVPSPGRRRSWRWRGRRGRRRRSRWPRRARRRSRVTRDRGASWRPRRTSACRSPAVVRPARGRPVGGGRSRPSRRLAARGRERDGERRRRVPALPSATVTSPIDERRSGVVVGDGARARAVGDRGVGGAGQVDGEGLVRPRRARRRSRVTAIVAASSRRRRTCSVPLAVT